MKLHRSLAFARAVLLLGALLAGPTVSWASAMAAVSTTIVDNDNQPIPGARVVFTGSAGSTYFAHTDAHGHASIKIPVDTYTIVASRNGYSSESVKGMNVAADMALSITIAASMSAPPPAAAPAHAVAGAPQPHVVAAAAMSSQPAALPPPPLVHDSLLATYDAKHPEHAKGEPYFGRYTYVLLAGTGATDPRNRALVAALVAKYGPAANNGRQTVIGNPYGYNIFFLPVTQSTHDFAATSYTTDALLAEYDYKTARYIHDRYCSEAVHTANSICAKPLGAGPFMLTFTRPLEGLRGRDVYPPAFAYDFSAVAADQYPAAVAIAARWSNVPEPMQADLELPPADLTKYVGPDFVATSDTMRRMVPAMKVYVDGGLAG